MIKEYELIGLSCANCALKIENALKKQDYVKTASVNFMNTTLKIEFTDTYRNKDSVMIERIVHKYEPDIIVAAKENNMQKSGKSTASDHSGRKSQITTLISGAIVFCAGFLIDRLLNADSYIVPAVFLVSYLILGGNVILRAIKNIIRGQIFDENFLMSIATIGALATNNFHEAVAVMLFYQIGEYFQQLAVHRSKKSIADLMDIRPDFANIKQNGNIIKVDPETVNTGDIIVVKPGEKIPLDGIVTEGESMLDTSALTGEPAPRKVSVSDTVFSGCINQTGVLTIEVTKTFGESTVAKIIDLVENASSKKAPAENFITVFSRYYTPIVVGLSALLAVIPPLFFGGLWAEWINRGLIFLVISCPCALVISIPLGFFGGIGRASAKGILVKGSNYLESLNNLDIVVFDKTGTLTKGVFEVTNIIPSNNFDKDDLLEIAAYAEAFSNHPIAVSVIKAYGKEIDKKKISDYTEISGYGISSITSGKKVLAGNQKLMQRENIIFNESTGIGTKIYIAVDGTFAGCIVISDEIKADSLNAIKKLKSKGIRKTVMLTGDNLQIAEAIANELGIDDVYAGLLPDQKVKQIEILNMQKLPKGKLAFVGDGINDAPVLARADVGIAMGCIGSDAAIEAADIVLMTDEPSKLAEAVDIARFTRRIVWQNIIFSLGIKGVFLLLGAFGIAGMLEAVFADVGVSLLAILNSMRAMRAK